MWYFCMASRHFEIDFLSIWNRALYVAGIKEINGIKGPTLKR